MANNLGVWLLAAVLVVGLLAVAGGDATGALTLIKKGGSGSSLGGTSGGLGTVSGCYSDANCPANFHCEYSTNPTKGRCVENPPCTDSDYTKMAVDATYPAGSADVRDSAYTQGTCTDRGNTYSDYCDANGQVAEYYCDPNAKVCKVASDHFGVSGTGSCSNGAWVNKTAIPECKDSDGNGGYFSKGTCTDATGTYTDYCENSALVRDYYCEGTYRGGALVSNKCVAGGYSALDGGCVDGAWVDKTTAKDVTECEYPNGQKSALPKNWQKVTWQAGESYDFETGAKNSADVCSIDLKIRKSLESDFWVGDGYHDEVDYKVLAIHSPDYDPVYATHQNTPALMVPDSGSGEEELNCALATKEITLTGTPYDLKNPPDSTDREWHSFSYYCARTSTGNLVSIHFLTASTERVVFEWRGV